MSVQTIDINEQIAEYAYLARQEAVFALRRGGRTASRLGRQALADAATEGIWKGLQSFDRCRGVPLEAHLRRQARYAISRAKRNEKQLLGRRVRRVDVGPAGGDSQTLRGAEDVAYRDWRREQRREEYLDGLRAGIESLGPVERKVAELRAASIDRNEIARQLGLSRSEMARLLEKVRERLG